MENKQKASILYIITQNEMGGAQRYVLDLAKAFKDTHTINVAFGENRTNTAFAKNLDQLDIPHHEVPELKRSISMGDDLKAWWALRKLIKKINPTIVHLNSSKVSVLGSLAGIGLKSKIVYTAHGWVFNEHLAEAKKKFLLHSEKFSAYFKDKIICVSGFDYDTALKYRVVAKSKLTTIHNGIGDFELWNRAKSREYLQEKISKTGTFENYDLVLGSIGHLYKNKGYDYLLNSLKSLKDKGINPLLLIIGKGSEEPELRNWIGQLNLEENVVLLGEIERASRLLKAFDIYICSSLKEGLSYTIIEAMVAGLPIIATKVGGNRELIEDNREGLLINPADKEEIAAAVIKMYNHSAKANEYAELAQKKALSRFNIEQMIQKTKYLYDSLL